LQSAEQDEVIRFIRALDGAYSRCTSLKNWPRTKTIDELVVGAAVGWSPSQRVSGTIIDTRGTVSYGAFARMVDYYAGGVRERINGRRGTLVGVLAARTAASAASAGRKLLLMATATKEIIYRLYKKNK
jgi:hypothetical protein